MKRSIVKLFVIILFILSGCMRFITHPTLSEEQHEVISAVIDSVGSLEFPPGSEYEVFNVTNLFINTSSIRYVLERDSVSVDTSVYGNYDIVNSQRYALRGIWLPDSVKLVINENMNPFQGCMDFTAPAISDDGTCALVEYGRMFAPLCGNGTAFLLRKIDGEWLIVWRLGIWIS